MTLKQIFEKRKPTSRNLSLSGSGCGGGGKVGGGRGGREGLPNRPALVTKNKNFPITPLFFEKFCFSLRVYLR